MVGPTHNIIDVLARNTLRCTIICVVLYCVVLYVVSVLEFKIEGFEVMNPPVAILIVGNC